MFGKYQNSILVNANHSWNLPLKTRNVPNGQLVKTSPNARLFWMESNEKWKAFEENFNYLFIFDHESWKDFGGKNENERHKEVIFVC